MPRVSVIIPTYNRAELVGEAIQSVLDQTYSDWELIVLDDGSTDGTAQVVAQFGERVTYVYQDNGGETAARNAGFAASHGELVSFLDSDDRMLPHNLETLVAILDTQPEVDVAYGWACWTDQDWQPFGDPEGPAIEGQILPQLLLEEIFIGTTLIRRGCVEAIGGFDEAVRFQGHWDFYLRLARAGCAYAYTKQPVTLLRLHSGSRGQDIEAMLASRIAILDRLLSDPALEATLAGVRHQAYQKTYLAYAQDYFALGCFEHSMICVNKALQHAPLDSSDLVNLSKKMANSALVSGVENPLRLARDLFRPVCSTAGMRHLQGKVLGEVNAELAFRHYQTEESGRVWRHALGAVIHDPSWLRNRGLVRIGLEGLVGPRIVDWIRSGRHPPSTKLLETAAQATSIFISPHLDDVVLSCGGTLAHLARRRAEVILVTVFTADSANEAQLSPLARQLHQEWNEDSHPFRLRRQEDRAVAERLGIKYRWLGFLDAIYRDPDLQDSGELFLTEFDPRSDPCFEPVRDAIWQLVNEHPGAIVFAPLGLGHHRDHLLVHHVLQDVKAMTSAASEYYYYEDYPYAAKADLRARLAELDWEAKPLSIDIADTFQERVRLITMHASQLSILFDDPDSVYERVMAYATRVGTKGKPRERFWSARAGSQQNGAGPGWSGR